MDKFKILITPWHGDPSAPPYIESTFTEKIDGKDPYNKPVYSNDWFNYSPMRAGKPVPLTDEYKLPPSFYWICSGVKKLDTDYYAHAKGVILSEDFYRFLQQYSCADTFEVAEVQALSKKLEPISDKKYFFLRFTKQSIQDYIDLAKSEKQKRENKVVPMFVYTDFAIKSDDGLPDYFWLKNELIAKQPLGDEINGRHFKGFKMVALKVYADEIHFRDQHPYPDLAIMEERDSAIFNT